MSELKHRPPPKSVSKTSSFQISKSESKTRAEAKKELSFCCEKR